MVKYEAIRIDSTPGEVVDLLSEAVQATNRRCRTRLLEDDPVKWRKAARQFQKSGEGWEMWRAGRGGVPASQIMCSWWTDLEGRKHAVIRGRRAESYGDREFLDRKTLERYPALWHCYPDRMYLRKSRGVSEWVCVCDCGVTGTPTSVGWMGTRCGPCYDTALEHGETEPEKKSPTTFSGAKGELFRVAISPNGKWIAGADLASSVHVWSSENGSHRVIRPGQMSIPIFSLGFTGDSKVLLPSFLARDFQLVGVNVESDPPRELPVTQVGQVPLFILPWADGTVCQVRQEGLEWIDPETRITVRRKRIPIGLAWQVIPSEDCSRLFVRVGNRCTIIDPNDGQILVRPEISDRGGLLYVKDHMLHVAYSSDFRRLAISHHQRINLIDGMTGRLINSVLTPMDPFQTITSPQSHAGLTFDASGDYLFVCGINGTIIIYRTADLTPLASFQWHIGYTRTFAANPQRTVLITGGSEGIVKLWPIDRLLTTINV